MGILEISEMLMKEKAVNKIIENLLQKTHHSPEEIAEVCEVPVADVIYIKSELHKMAS